MTAMVRKNRCWLLGICLLSTILLWGCNGAASPTPVSAPPATPAPVIQSTTEIGDPRAPATLQPTYTPYPTYTQYPTFTPFAVTPTPRSPETSTLTVLGIHRELEVTITRVIDGDTFEFELSDGNKDVIRLLAVDTPETKAPNKPNEYAGITDIACLDLWGHRAAEFATIELEGQTVKLLLEGRTLDELFSFGRLLAIVIKGGENFNALLIERGLARVFTEKPNSKEAEFLDLQQQAQAQGVGLWECAKSDSAPGVNVTPAPTAVLTASPTLKPEPTATPVPAPTSTPTPEPTARPTSTAVATLTPIQTPVPTPSPVPTATLAPTPTPTATPIPPPTATATPTATPEPVPSSVGCEEGQVDINSASAEELELIIHIGPARAAEAVQLRPFSSLDDLVRINGIGPSRLADIKAQDLACVGA